MKFSENINLKNGDEVNINFMDYLTVSDDKRFPVKFALSGKLPSGLAFNDDKITGILNVASKDELKRYNLNVTASNLLGTSRAVLSLTLRDIPKIEEFDESALNGKVGRKFRFQVPTKTKYPYKLTDTFMGFHCGNTPFCRLNKDRKPGVKYQLKIGRAHV